MSQSDNEDVWADSGSEASYEKNLANVEWERLQEDHGNTGYKEGIVEGKEVNMQRGFDKGYTEGLAIGQAIGRLRGLLSCQIVYYRQLLQNEEAAKELDPLFEEIDKIEVHHIYTVDHFRESGPKANYTSPQEQVKQLENKVDLMIKQVNNKYAC
ncbi:hypothetical protein INT47_004653 [Mucor saturninus]|uniref:Protein YAE1 n=1 Tax=Mucor saturninus TaxID=64648 RepID=A0A8H7RLR7_9FUNG|nr:hypothetical protein INT47_004653 [Mucor saturninus]